MNKAHLAQNTVSDSGSGALRLAELAPRPRSGEETGLSPNLLQDLLAKHLLDNGISDLRHLVDRLALAGPIVESVLGSLRSDGHVEIRSALGGTNALRYALTDRGRAFALEALMRNGYLGPAPVPLEQYRQLVEAQSVHQYTVTQAKVEAFFANVVIRDSVLDQLGPALNSGRAIFVYGPPGTGKTYISQRLAGLMGDSILIPHAVAIGDTPVQLFDPVLHDPLDPPDSAIDLMLERGHDPRFVHCRRPAVVTGGELTLDMLEVQYDPATRIYRAPLQLKANNGIYLIDDLGRQRVDPVDLFNRWIVPMEYHKDYLTLASGRRFPVPFDVILVFSTNLHPLDLADEAFLRRLGYKIYFSPLDPEQYRRIWQQVCAERNISCNEHVLRYAIDELHAKHQKPLLPCHPRDLLGMAVDQAEYAGAPRVVTKELLHAAWNSYFVRLEDTPTDGLLPKTSH